MNPDHLVPNHIPDENYIQRLFPKCPPTTNNNSNSNNKHFTRSSSAHEIKRQTSSANRKQVGNQQQEAPYLNNPKRLNRPRVLQHSRRELEARRARVRLANQSQSKLVESSDSSSDELSNRTLQQQQQQHQHQSSFKKANHAQSMSHSVSFNSNFRSSLKRDVEQPSKLLAQTESSNVRRQSKYNASKNYLQRLDKPLELVSPVEDSTSATNRTRPNVANDRLARMEPILAAENPREDHSLSVLPCKGNYAILTGDVKERRHISDDSVINQIDLVSTDELMPRVPGSYPVVIGSSNIDAKLDSTTCKNQTEVEYLAARGSNIPLNEHQADLLVQKDNTTGVVAINESSHLGGSTNALTSFSSATSTPTTVAATPVSSFPKTADAHPFVDVDQQTSKTNYPASQSSSTVDSGQFTTQQAECASRGCTIPDNCSRGDSRNLGSNQPKYLKTQLDGLLVDLDQQELSNSQQRVQHKKRSRTIRFSDEPVTLLAAKKSDSISDSIEITEIIEEDDDDNGQSERKDEEKYNRDDSTNSSCNDSREKVVSILHQAGQDLLASGAEDARNDVSTEELCNLEDHDENPSSDAGFLTFSSTKLELGGINTETLSSVKTLNDEADAEDSTLDTNFDMTPTSSSHSRRGFVTPGYPQRISLGPSVKNNPKQPITLSALNHEEQENQMTQIKQQHDQGQRETLTGEPCDKQPHIRRTEHQPAMPSISESQHESDQEVAIKLEEEAKAIIGIDLLSISSKRDDAIIGRLTTSDQAYKAQDSNFSNTNIESKDVHGQDLNQSGNLRHHKIPNEANHYSIVRAMPTSTATTDRVAAPDPSSSLQFQILSEVESGAEDPTDSLQNLIANKRSLGLATRNNNELTAATMDSQSNMPISSTKFEDDMLPSAKTALIFPRLDEGLSSGAESCDDEIEYDDDCDDERDDERAMDADVDDDEDKVDILGVEDDLESDSRPNSTTNSIMNSSSDSYYRSQPRSQLKTVESQQHIHGPPVITCSAALSHSSDHHQQIKVPIAQYASYMGQNSVDQSDMKLTSNQSIHNGSSANYWMSAGQNDSISTQPGMNQHFSTRNSGLSNNFGPKLGGAQLQKNEVKSTNRMSSDTDNETDRLLGVQRNEQLKLANHDIDSADPLQVAQPVKQTTNSREVLIEGVLFNVKYLGETQSDCDGRGDKEDRIAQADMAANEVRFRNGDGGTEVQLFISTEKIMVLDDKERKVKLDQSLRTISYVANLNDAVVLIVRKKGNSGDSSNGLGRPISKTVCHVFESNESGTITQSISQAFQVAYTELLKANGVADSNAYLPKEQDYQEVLNSQEMSTEELEMFARKENQREVIVPKEKGEILGLSIVESGWGSVLPTVVIANLKHDGPAYRCKKLSIGDQILSVNGISLVGLPLTDCQEILRRTKNQRVARLSVVPCPITVEVKIKRPDTKYQLGFSVQNGVICSLLRGGIAERGGVRVGHRIMSINGTTVVGVPHEKIVTLLASSVGEIRMKTCLTSLYRLILGEENPVHF